jgi:colanic acid/amylovoran biosynthesis glycosyltransferase
VANTSNVEAVDSQLESPCSEHREISDQEIHNLQELAQQQSAVSQTKQPLKIGFLTSEYPKASHTFIRRELLALEKRGHEIARLSVRDASSTVVDPADKSEASKTTVVLNLPIAQLVMSTIRTAVTRPIKFIKAVAETYRLWRASDRGVVRHVTYLVEAATLLWILRREGTKHLHVHFGKNAADVALMLKILGGPTYSMMIHGPGEFDGPRTFSLGRKVEQSEFTAAISHFATGQLRRWVSYAHWDKLHVVRCTISDDFLSERHGVDPDSRKLVCIGRLTGQKGQLFLIDAIGDLVDEGVDVNLTLAGDGEMREIIEERIKARGLQDRIEITGWIGEKDVRRHLIESRAMVLPSFAEGLPVAIMEALALGRPVVSTSIAAIPELLRNGENGWVIPSGSHEDLVAALRDLMTTPVERLNEMGRAGHERVRRQHHADTEAAKLDDLLQEFVAK